MKDIKRFPSKINPILYKLIRNKKNRQKRKPKKQENNKMKAKIIYMWDNWESYYVNNVNDCKDNTDKSAYKTLKQTGEKCIQMGKVCIERL